MHKTNFHFQAAIFMWGKIENNIYKIYIYMTYNRYIIHQVIKSAKNKKKGSKGT